MGKGKSPTPPRPLLKSPELIEPVDGLVTGILTSTTFRWKSIPEAVGYHFELSNNNASGVNEMLCKIDDGKWTRYTGAFSIYETGTHRIRFQATDTVGNQSKEEIIDVIVNNIQP